MSLQLLGWLPWNFVEKFISLIVKTFCMLICMPAGLKNSKFFFCLILNEAIYKFSVVKRVGSIWLGTWEKVRELYDKNTNIFLGPLWVCTLFTLKSFVGSYYSSKDTLASPVWSLRLLSLTRVLEPICRLNLIQQQQPDSETAHLYIWMIDDIIRMIELQVYL